MQGPRAAAACYRRKDSISPWVDPHFLGLWYNLPFLCRSHITAGGQVVEWLKAPHSKFSGSFIS